MYVPNAVAGAGTDNLVPLGEAGNTASLRLEGVGASAKSAHAWAAVNSLGILDLIQIAAEGLRPKAQYQVYLSESEHPPFDRLLALAVLKTNPDGAGIVQAIGPLKTLVGGGGSTQGVPSRRFLIVCEMQNASQIVLQQAAPKSQ